MTLPPEILLSAYRQGIFPMAEDAADEEFAFYRPHLRGLIPIQNLHVPRSLRKIIQRDSGIVTVNRAFVEIIDGCAAAVPARQKTWINRPIRDLFIALHERGHAHSIELWDTSGTRLRGGLYGLAIGAVFCGESMVSFESGASKIALVHLCALLDACGFTILDSQFLNPHLIQFGAYEVPQEDYEAMIAAEMEKPVPFDPAQLTRARLEAFLASTKSGTAG